MKTTKNLTIKNTVLATIAVAGLVAGTAACGGKNTNSAETEKQALVELLLAAAQSGDAGKIAEVVAQADPGLVADVLPEITLDVTPAADEAPVASETVTPEEAAPVAPEAEVAPEEDTAVTPEEDSAVTPEEDAAPADDATEAPEEDVAPEDDESTPDFDFDFDLDLDVPEIMPTFNVVPEIDGALVFADGLKYKMTIFVNEGSTLLLADIQTVTVRFTSSTGPIRLPITKQATLGSSDGDSSIWTISGLPVNEGDILTVTATNRLGESDTMQVKVSAMMPL
ncbi:MAG: hypothetical protein ACO31G_10310 [Ilumatobacteraceae bacterium]